MGADCMSPPLAFLLEQLMSRLFSPFTMRGLTLRNRTVVSPMCQYSAKLGLADDWHLVHLGRFALGGFGLVLVEASAVSPEGRISYGDLGLWSNAHIPPLARIVDFLHGQNAAAGIQIAHAGRKGSTASPWRKIETEQDKRRYGYEDWQPVAPSAIAHSSAYKQPHELTTGEIADLVDTFQAAAERALIAGFDVLEIHCAHGYLINEFLSPLANSRSDRYGGSLENRMRFALEIVDAVRKVWPEDKPLFARFSVQDWNENGWQIVDSIVLAQEMKTRGVDLIDCSSGGFAEGSIKPGPAYQLPFAEAVRAGAGIPTMAIGLLGDAVQAEGAIADGKADLVALARPALEDPNWPAHAHRQLDPGADFYALYPPQAGYAIRAMDKVLSRT